MRPRRAALPSRMSSTTRSARVAGLARRPASLPASRGSCPIRKIKAHSRKRSSPSSVPSRCARMVSSTSRKSTPVWSMEAESWP